MPNRADQQDTWPAWLKALAEALAERRPKQAVHDVLRHEWGRHGAAWEALGSAGALRFVRLVHQLTRHWRLSTTMGLRDVAHYLGDALLEAQRADAVARRWVDDNRECPGCGHPVLWRWESGRKVAITEGAHRHACD